MSPSDSKIEIWGNPINETVTFSLIIIIKWIFNFFEKEKYLEKNS